MARTYKREPEDSDYELPEEDDDDDETSPDDESSEEEVEEKKPAKKAKRGPKPRITSRQWWRADEIGRDPNEILDQIVREIEQDQSGRYAAYREYERLFGATETDYGDDSFKAIGTDELTQNELQNVLETIWTQVFKNRIVPAVSADEADFYEWDKAKGYSRWLEGAFDEGEVYEEAYPQAGIYTLVYGTGPIKVGYCTPEPGKAQITYTAVNPKLLAVDRLEARHGKPRCLYEKNHIDRYLLHSVYGEDNENFYGSAANRRKKIADCTANDDMELGTQATTKCDMLTVREAWHLPSSKTANDGKHCIWIRGCTLVYEEFSWDTFPFVFMRFGARVEGFYGESAVKRLAPTQKNLDKLNKKIDESQDVMGVPRIIVAKSSGLKKGHIDDIPGGILEINNIGMVKDWNAQCASPELYNDRDNAPNKMRSLMGVSNFDVTQNIPQGMRDVSGEMIERWVEQGPNRHAMLHAQYENSVPKLAKLSMLQAEHCDDMGLDVIVRAPSDSPEKSSVDTLKFGDVKVAMDKLRVKVQSMSQLPQTFAGKVEAIEKLRKAEVPLDPKTALRMLEIPDVHTATDMLVSDEEIISKNLCHMAKYGEYLPPLPYDNLDLIIQMTTRYINRYRVRNDADSYVVAILAQYIDAAVTLKNGLGAGDPNAPPTVPTLQALGMGSPIGTQGVAPMALPPGQAPPNGAPMAAPLPAPQPQMMAPQGMGPGPMGPVQ
jgi:hypothetical protein